MTSAMGKTTDRATKLHLEDVKDQIAKALDPKFAQTPVGPALLQVTRPSVWEMDCWHDYEMELLTEQH
jgi:hypothetical protein